jgi:hypothetical protein
VSFSCAGAGRGQGARDAAGARAARSDADSCRGSWRGVAAARRLRQHQAHAHVQPLPAACGPTCSGHCLHAHAHATRATLCRRARPHAPCPPPPPPPRHTAHDGTGLLVRPQLLPAPVHLGPVVLGPVLGALCERGPHALAQPAACCRADARRPGRGRLLLRCALRVLCNTCVPSTGCCGRGCGRCARLLRALHGLGRGGGGGGGEAHAGGAGRRGGGGGGGGGVARPMRRQHTRD